MPEKSTQSYTDLFELEVGKNFETGVKTSIPKCCEASDPNSRLAALCLVLCTCEEVTAFL